MPVNTARACRPLEVTRRGALARIARLTGFASAGALAAGLPAQAQTPTDWSAIEARARGQTVYFNAWGGSERVNNYLRWAGEELTRLHGVKLEHVKLTDTAEAVRRVRGEKAAGRGSDGSVDALWINGENFLTMKREGLLFGPFAQALPNDRLVDTQGKPTTRIDFSEPVDGMEAPWGMAQFTFYADRQRLKDAPTSMAELAALARANPGRVTYPRPPAFIGTTFLKQALLELTPGAELRALLYRPWSAQAMERVAAPLWTWLDALHPHLWRAGRQFPATPAALRQMMADGELLLAMSFNPNEAANEIAAHRLPETVHTWQHPRGTIGNTHFLAIPFNAKAREGAQVFINFMLSPAAQARKADIAVWGDPTVLALDRLSPAERALFGAQARAGQLTQTAPTLPEPHGSWVDPLEREWQKRYAQ